MSANEKKDSVDKKEFYGSPEIVRMGDAVELTAGRPEGEVSDGGMKPNGYQPAVSEPPTPPTTPTPSPKPADDGGRD